MTLITISLSSHITPTTYLSYLIFQNALMSDLTMHLGTTITCTETSSYRKLEFIRRCVCSPANKTGSCCIRCACSLIYRPHQIKLDAAQVGFLAQKRLARGLRLNRTEAVALISSQLQERIRDGGHTVAELMQHGKTLLGRRHVLPDVPTLLHDIQVEGTFHDG